MNALWPLLTVGFLAGAWVGLGLKITLDRAELAAYRRIARLPSEQDGTTLETILSALKELQMSTTTTSQEIATLSTDEAALTSAVQAAVTGFATLNAQIATLQASGGLSASDAASLTASVNGIASDTATLAGATPAVSTVSGVAG